MADEFVSTCKVSPDYGTVTWESEGTEGGLYHSRKLHVPTDSSGLTLGRGYDMRAKNAGTIVGDLTKAGVSAEQAKLLSGAAGLSGESARKFITDNSLEKFEIDQCGQKTLFDSTYEAEEAEARRLAQKADVVEKYGACNWDQLDPTIKDIVVDLKYRGDYTGDARALIQKHIVANDLEAFAKALSEKTNWPNVPKDRFDRRKALLEQAVADKKAKEALVPKLK